MSDFHRQRLVRFLDQGFRYPVAYIALLVPYAIMRLLVISGFTVSFEAMIFAFVCWYSLG